MLDKEEICKNFSQSAGNYDEHAALQHRLADELFSQLTTYNLQLTSILDLGCGTGYLTAKLAGGFPSVMVTGIDIAPGMIAEAREKRPRHNVRYEVADAEQLLYPKCSFDLIVCNAALQWMRPRIIFYTVSKLLKPGGSFCFNTFGPKTLLELRRSGFRVNDSPSLDELKADAGKLFRSTEWQIKCVKEKFKDTRELLNYLKELGAQAVDAKTKAPFLTRAALISGPTAATFEIIFGHFVV